MSTAELLLGLAGSLAIAGGAYGALRGSLGGASISVAQCIEHIPELRPCGQERGAASFPGEVRRAVGADEAPPSSGFFASAAAYARDIPAGARAAAEGRRDCESLGCSAGRDFVSAVPVLGDAVEARLVVATASDVLNGRAHVGQLLNEGAVFLLPGVLGVVYRHYADGVQAGAHLVVDAVRRAVSDVEIPAPRFASLVDAVKTGQLPSEMTADELRALQAHALETVQRTFKDEHGLDADLLAAARAKAAHYGNVTDSVDGDVALGRGTFEQQVDALKILVHTFRGEGDDVALRAAALDKLASMGRAADIPDILPVVRKPPHSSDLHKGLEAVHAIMARAGSPIARGAHHLSDETRGLLAKEALTDGERAAVIQDVLAHGEIVSVVKNQSPTANDVYFLRFNETLPGPDGTRVPIEGVWKAEGTFVDKQKPTFTREVSAYEFTQRFSKVDIVPVTVEGVLAADQLPGPLKPSGVGSIQYKVPGGQSIGRGYPDSRLLKPEFEEYMKTPEAQQQMREIRTHLYVLNDPEKLPNSGGFDVPNWGNILAAPDPSRPGGYKLYIIDNGTGQGALTQFGAVIHRDMVPDGPPTQTARNLGHVGGDSIQHALAPQIGEVDAADIRRRVHDVAIEKDP